MSQPQRIVIVGGVAGGASAAARARRLSEEAEIVVLERGKHVSFANCGMPYHIGGAIADRDRLLVATPQSLRKRYRIDVRTRTEALRINRDRKTVTVRDLETGTESEERYDALILSPGAEPIRPPIPGIDAPGVFTLRNLADMDAIKAVVDAGMLDRAVVGGGGYIGLEMTEALRQRGVAVTLVELARQVFVAADPEMVAPIHQQLEMHGVDLQLGTSVTAIAPQDGGLAVTLSTGKTVSCGLVILAVGVRPENKLAREAGLEIGATGGIVVDEHLRTGDASIYAVGDAIEFDHFIGGHKAVIPLAGPANRQGRIAADNIFGRPSVYHSTQGTAICKVFDLTVGMTGLSEKALARAGRRYEKVYVHPANHAAYYPGASQLSLKLLFDPDDGRILGAQAVGSEGVDKRIDVLAVALRGGLTVEDLSECELAYAPPYGSAKDPVNYAGFVASNVRSGDMPVCHVADVLAPGDGKLLLDVRTLAEVQAGTIPGARNIPIDELRDRLEELPRDKEILAFCQVGLRGYLATRILTAHGFRCRNLSGGYKTYKAVTGMMPPDEPPPKEVVEDTGETAGAIVNAPVAGGKLSPFAPPPPLKIVRTIDARAMQCPGPILRLKAEMETVGNGEAVTILSGDPGFPSDARGWCHATGNRLVEIVRENGGYRATIVRKAPAARQGLTSSNANPPLPRGAIDNSSRANEVVTAPAGIRGLAASASSPEMAPAGRPGLSPSDAPEIVPMRKTIVCFSGDFDKAMATFIIANGAAAMGSEVTIFFTFWGINILRRSAKVKVRKDLIERVFGWMMPRGAGKLALSKLNMAGMGTAMIKGIMRKKNVPSLPELIRSAQQAGVRLVACTMTMDLMGIRKEELIAGVEEGGVAMYLDSAEQAGVNLFI